jgi:NAD(P)H-dependent FMN reductase
MTAKPRIALIIGSIRPTRFADKPAQWMLKQAQARNDMEVELVDLRDHPLPFFAEVASNLHAPSKDPEALRWQERIAGFDGFIFVVSEYNHSITGGLKNALDHAYKEWNRKPFTAIAYGGAGGARALEHLRGIAVELQMVSTRSAVHIGGSDFMKVFPMGGNKPIEEIEQVLLPAATNALDELSWWANATMAARTPTTSAAGLRPASST